jgi:hypothetical protein
LFNAIISLSPGGVPYLKTTSSRVMHLSWARLV